MRVAPPVDHPLARRGLWAGAAAALAALAAAAPVLWAGDHLQAMRWEGGWVRWGIPLLAAVVALVFAVTVWRRLSQARERRFRWDGTVWQLRGDADTVELDQLTLRIDLGHAALLRARTSSGRNIWLPVERRDAPASWHGLRVALSQPQAAGETALPAPGGAAA
jgi:hypothetical protein